MSSVNLNYAFCAPEPGKPNPYEPKVPGQMRSRVVFKGQKGPTCGFYAMQILRNENKIGKYPSLAQEQESKIEKMLSCHRKEITAFDQKWKFTIDFAEGLSDNYSGKEKMIAKQFLINVAKKGNKDNSVDLNTLIQLENFIKSPYEKFSDVVQIAKFEERQLIYNSLLTQVGVTFENIDEYARNFFERDWNELENNEKLVLLNNLVSKYAVEHYQLKASQRHPSDSVIKLIEQIQLHGSHLVKGFFGKINYEEKPFELDQKVEGRPGFGWKIGATQNKNMTSIHNIIIVGAESRNNQNRVYFIDPLDSIYPNDLSTQNIYAMSYKKLQSSICSLECRMHLDNSYEPQVENGPNNYALHS
ncbi:MAG: hypothetical protein V4494_02825 [Chlamydiota bacterium]